MSMYRLVRHARGTPRPTRILAAGVVLGAASVYVWQRLRRLGAAAAPQPAQTLLPHARATDAQQPAANQNSSAAHVADVLPAPEQRLRDETLMVRVRAVLSRLSRHPQAIEVTAHDGHVELSGPIGRKELPLVLHGVQRVRGTLHVIDRMQTYDERRKNVAVSKATH